MPGGTQLDGKVAIVTGGSRGIGQATAARFVAAGAKVAIVGRTKADLDKAVLGFAHGGGMPGAALGVQADVAKEADVARIVEETIRAFGRLDIVVNNAATVKLAPVEALAPADWQAMLDANLTAPFLLCRAALPHLKASGGSIINVSSLAGKNPFKGGSAYNASKFGLNGFSEAIMQDLRYDNIRVSYVMPGSVNTRFGQHEVSSDSSWKLAPEDVAQVVVGLLQHDPRSLPSAVEMRPSKPKQG